MTVLREAGGYIKGYIVSCWVVFFITELDTTFNIVEIGMDCVVGRRIHLFAVRLRFV